MDAEAQAAWLYIDLSVILTVLTLPSHIDKQGNADTTADTGAKLKKILISEVTIYRSMRPMIMKALKSKIYQTGC